MWKKERERERTQGSLRLSNMKRSHTLCGHYLHYGFLIIPNPRSQKSPSCCHQPSRARLAYSFRKPGLNIKKCQDIWSMFFLPVFLHSSSTRRAYGMERRIWTGNHYLGNMVFIASIVGKRELESRVKSFLL